MTTEVWAGVVIGFNIVRIFFFLLRLSCIFYDVQTVPGSQSSITVSTPIHLLQAPPSALPHGLKELALDVQHLAGLPPKMVVRGLPTVADAPAPKGPDSGRNCDDWSKANSFN